MVRSSLQSPILTKKNKWNAICLLNKKRRMEVNIHNNNNNNLSMFAVSLLLLCHLCVPWGVRRAEENPFFLEPYLSCSLPSWKQPANASRHTDINIISNLLCILCTFFFFNKMFTTSSTATEMHCMLTSTVAGSKAMFKLRALWMHIRDRTQERAKYSQPSNFSHETVYYRDIKCNFLTSDISG